VNTAKWLPLKITLGSPGWRSKVESDGKLLPVIRLSIRMDVHGETTIEMELDGGISDPPHVIEGVLVDQETWEAFQSWQRGEEKAHR
jgi:hypothetical protein